MDCEEAHINKLEAEGAHVVFLAGWSPWQKALQRSNPTAFAQFEKKRDDDREWLVCIPDGMTDWQYIAECATQKARDEAGLMSFTTRLTRQFMENKHQAEK